LNIVKNNLDYNPEQKLEELGIQLSTPSSPVANYVNTIRSGNLVYISGKGPLKKDGSYVLGKLGENLTLEQGYEAAHLIAINLISTLKASIGDLSKVKRIVRLTGMVNATSDFTDNSKVMMVVLTYLLKYLERTENIRE
jgi:enamine deaminase RidA (YjgF/YER057c/UK114 family)